MSWRPAGFRTCPTHCSVNLNDNECVSELVSSSLCLTLYIDKGNQESVGPLGTRCTNLIPLSIHLFLAFLLKSKLSRPSPSPNPLVHMTLGKILNPNLLLVVKLAPCMALTVTSEWIFTMATFLYHLNKSTFDIPQCKKEEWPLSYNEGEQGDSRLRDHNLTPLQLCGSWHCTDIYILSWHF